MYVFNSTDSPQNLTEKTILDSLPDIGAGI